MVLVRQVEFKGLQRQDGGRGGGEGKTVEPTGRVPAVTIPAEPTFRKQGDGIPGAGVGAFGAAVGSSSARGLRTEVSSGRALG